MFLWNIVTKLCIHNSSLNDENGAFLTDPERTYLESPHPTKNPISPLKQHQNENMLLSTKAREVDIILSEFVAFVLINRTITQ